MEMMNTLLETGGKGILVTETQTTWLNCAHILVFSGRLTEVIRVRSSSDRKRGRDFCLCMRAFRKAYVRTR